MRKVSLLLLLLAQPLSAQTRTWLLGPFVKAPGNPVISPSAAATFLSPIDDVTVRWEEYATFNPAAIVRGGRIHVLYRAEDSSGEMRIGRHTSRIGLAVSDDGVRFTRRPAPVLFPAHDAQHGNERPGGGDEGRSAGAGAAPPRRTVMRRCV